MKDVLGYDSAFKATTWANVMNLGMNHAPHAGLIAQHVDLQSGMPPLCMVVLNSSSTKYYLDISTTIYMKKPIPDILIIWIY